MARLRSLVPGSRQIAWTPGVCASRPFALQTMARCLTAGKSFLILSTTAALSGLSPERASERSSPPSAKLGHGERDL